MANFSNFTLMDSLDSDRKQDLQCSDRSWAQPLLITVVWVLWLFCSV